MVVADVDGGSDLDGSLDRFFSVGFVASFGVVGLFRGR